MKLNKAKSSSTHRIIVYGAPKTGKTELVGKLSEYYKLIWVDMENGHETLFKLPEAWQERIELINLPDTRDYPIAAETCLKMVRKAITICNDHGKADCMVCKRAEAEVVAVDLAALGPDTVVVFDSLTQLSNSMIAHITKNQPDDYKLDYDDWGNLGKLLDVFLSALQQAKYNVVVISHEQEIEGENKKKSLTPVGGTRNYSRNVAKFFDHVIYAERKNRKHSFASSTQYATNILTGSRTDIVMEDSAEPSLLAIFKPELYKNTKPTATNAATNAGAGAAGTKKILANLKNR